MLVERLQQRMRVSSPGKVIVFGEHSAVYGKRALAFSLGLRTELTFTPAENSVSLHLPEIKVEETWTLDVLRELRGRLDGCRKSKTDQPKSFTEEEEMVLKEFLKIDKAEIGKRELGLMAFFHLYTTILPHPVPFAISVRSQMPVGAGLGSSAAYGVCLAAIFQWLTGSLNLADLKSDFCKENEALGSVCEWALCCEKILHGTPSGIDNAICTYGQGISFKSGKIEVLKAPSLRIILVNTCVPRNTKSIIAKVREKYERLDFLLDSVFSSMDALAESAVATIKEMNANSLTDECFNSKIKYLQELVDLNHGLLSALGVSHPRLDRLVSIAQSHGLHAKLTGAGGGGFGFVLLSPDVPEEDIAACCEDYRKEGYEIWITCLGGYGVSLTPLATC